MTCSVDGCENTAWARSWCRKHYMRWWEHGSTSTVKKAMPPAGAVNGFVDFAAGFSGDDCLIWPYSDNGAGYGLMTMDGKRVLVTRVICERIYGPPPSPEHHAAHSCGHGHLGCITPRHLRWATPAENTADMIVHGTKIYGEDHPFSKLKEAQVMAIFHSAGTQVEIADRFGISQTLVSKIKLRKRWAWLTKGEAA